jgi:hypothetical protein
VAQYRGSKLGARRHELSLANSSTTQIAKNARREERRDFVKATGFSTVEIKHLKLLQQIVDYWKKPENAQLFCDGITHPRREPGESTMSKKYNLLTELNKKINSNNTEG